MKKLAFLLFTIGMVFSIQSQNKLNDYGYVIIPNQFSFQSEPNEYNINKVLQATLNKYNFKAFIKGDEIIEGINPCDILHLDVDKSGFMATKMTLIFNDCYGKEILTSIEGKSRIKEFQSSYFEALGAALKDKNISEHKYIPKETVVKKAVTKAVVKKTETITNHNTPEFTLEFKNKKYAFVKTTNNSYNILVNNNLVGTLKQEKTNETYTINTTSIKGTGIFDDFGNFILTRVNPVNNATIQDTMARIN
ncbi:hypothetical protein [Wenyingzhuangia aestuarii]|uniref:hypothetical protein n=1 Tax=Wenyingzhuangia aestuarii TaxID=1647582 RepID=UPI00143BE4CA|nr:hypothetical protein [Wenyingzhuangia aestuarii]NJB82451.1 hypothetical protein [Wenyingzhuangia aestuarii]